MEGRKKVLRGRETGWAKEGKKEIRKAMDRSWYKMKERDV